MTFSLVYDIRPITPADEPSLWEMLYQAMYVKINHRGDASVLSPRGRQYLTFPSADHSACLLALIIVIAGENGKEEGDYATIRLGVR